MSRQDEILAVVRQYVDDLGHDPTRIVPEAKLRDLGIDSLHAVDLVFRFEEKFEIDIPMEEFGATTVAEAISFIEKQIGPLDRASPE